jgi:Outer membrane protein beta-barrel domain
MNRRFLCVALVILAMAYAKPASAQHVGGGFKIGVNWSTLSGAVDVDEGVRADKDLRTGLLVGGFVTFNLFPGLSLQPEVLYSQQGVKLTQGGQEATAELDYVQVPVLLRIGGSGKGAAGLYGIVGPSFGFATSTKITQSGQPDLDIDDQIKSNETGIVFGVGITLSRFLIEGRYTEGLTDINEESVGFINNNLINKNRNRVFAAVVGLHF